MRTERISDAVACGGLFACYLPQVEVVNGYLTLLLTTLSLAWLGYQFLKSFKKKGE